MVWLKRSALIFVMLAAPLSAQDAEAPQAEANVAAPGPFIIFFDWDGRSIARDDGEILEAVIAAHRANPDYQLKLIGHSDLSGPAAHNKRLARNRAVVVRDHLVEQGVPSAAISVSSAGEERPLIATADGVREAQNRRVEVEFVR